MPTAFQIEKIEGFGSGDSDPLEGDKGQETIRSLKADG